jgi:hypothetical protein
MNKVLAGRELFSDGPADDERWLRIIFDEAGPEPTFTIQRLHANVLMSQLAAKLGWDSAGYEAAKTEVARMSPKTHRAPKPMLAIWRALANHFKGPQHADNRC